MAGHNKDGDEHTTLLAGETSDEELEPNLSDSRSIASNGSEHHTGSEKSL